MQSPCNLNIFSANERTKNPITRTNANTISIETLMQIGKKVEKQKLSDSEEVFALQSEINNYLYGSALR